MKYSLFLVAGLFCFCTCFAADTTQLNNYHNRVLKVFNQCCLLDTQLTESIKTKSPEDIEHARIRLLDYANSGMREIDSIENFEGDAALKFMCKDVLKFYKQMAESDIPQVRDFFTVEQNFLRIKKEFEKKPVKKHSQSEIIAYNSEANKYNQAVTRYNQVTAFIEGARKNTLYNWNASEKIFMDAHRARS